MFPQQEAIERWLLAYQERLLSEGCNPEQRYVAMKAINPKYILRNYLLQQAIDLAKENDFSLVSQLLDMLQAPYDDKPEYAGYAKPPPAWGKGMAISCSS